MGIAQNWQALRQAIGDRDITVVAATKYANITQLQEAYHAGIRHFGENRVQDALEKQAHFPPAHYPDLRWHLIGSLQTNKINKTLSRFELIHSIDSVRLAEKLSAANAAQGLVQSILLQVNFADDPTRHGFLPSEVIEAAVVIERLAGVKLKGLMAMAPHVDDSAILRGVFRSLADMRKSLRDDRGIDLPELSMGMTHDFVHALECGATIIRIGSYLFQN